MVVEEIQGIGTGNRKSLNKLSALLVFLQTQRVQACTRTKLGHGHKNDFLTSLTPAVHNHLVRPGPPKSLYSAGTAAKTLGLDPYL